MKTTTRQLVLTGMKSVSAAVDTIRTPPFGATILIYHQVGGGTELELDLDPAAFVAHLQLLTNRNVITLDALHEQLVDPAIRTDERPVVVTFDDGTQDFVDVVVPLLVEYAIPATLYLATDFVERGVSLPHGAKPPTWSGLADAVSTGLVTVGSHTHTHAVLGGCSPSTVAGELDRSIDLIGERLGVRADHFAYPKGVGVTGQAEDVVRDRFDTAARGECGPNPWGLTDAHRLKRSPIQRADGQRWFAKKVDGGLAWEGTLRESLNARRYANRQH